MDASVDARKRLLRRAVEGGVVMVAGAALGFGGYVYGMIDSFRRIERMTAPTPGDLAEGVATALRWFAIGGIVFAAGAILLVVALIQHSRVDAQLRARASWTAG